MASSAQAPAFEPVDVPVLPLPTGRARSALNALTHGLCGRTVVMPGEDAQAFEALRGGLIADWAPEGDEERALVERIAVATWRQQRAWALEAGMFDALRERMQAPQASDAHVFLNDAKQANGLTKLDRREAAVHRVYLSSVRLLVVLQDLRRKSLRHGATHPAIELPPDAPPTEPATPSPVTASAETPIRNPPEAAELPPNDAVHPLSFGEGAGGRGYEPPTPSPVTAFAETPIRNSPDAAKLPPDEAVLPRSLGAGAGGRGYEPGLFLGVRIPPLPPAAAAASLLDASPWVAPPAPRSAPAIWRRSGWVPDELRAFLGYRLPRRYALPRCARLPQAA